MASADAHPGHSRSSRLLLVDLGSDPPLLSYGLIFEPSAADAGRKRADTDGDGAVSAAEGQAELERLTTELRSNLSVCRGTTLQGAQCSRMEEAQVAETRATGWTEKPGRTLALTWQFRLDLAADDRVVRVEDSSFLPDVDRTDATIEAPQEMRLVAAGQGVDGPPSGITRELMWRDDRPSEPRKLFVMWESPAPRWAIIAVVGAAALLMIGQLVVVRHRRRQGVTLA